MNLNPLASRIYRTLIRQARSPNPLITYGDLVRTLGPLPPPDADLKPNDERLFEALEQIFHACRNHRPPLPVPTALVVRRTENGSLGTPGAGYFALVFPNVWDEDDRLQLWQEEVTRIRVCTYPEDLSTTKAVRPQEPFPPFPPIPLPTPSSEAGRRRGWLHEPTVIAAIIGLMGTLATVAGAIWVATRPTEPRPEPAPVETVTTDAPSTASPRQPLPQQAKPDPPKPTLDSILEVLERHHQRATFGAVAALLGREPQTLFSGYVRTPRTAWVVSKTTGLPTGTKETEYPGGLLQNKKVIDSVDELREWLRGH